LKGKIGSNANMKVTYGDTQSTLPKFLQGRVQGASYGDDTARTVTYDPNASKAGAGVGGKAKRRLNQQVGAGRVLPRGAAEKDLQDNTKVKTVDKKGRKYHTGEGSSTARDRRKAKRDAKFKSKYGRRSNKNPVVKWFAQQIKAFKRKLALRQQNKVPVVLGDRARAVTEALEMTQKQLKVLRLRFMEIDFSHMGNVSYEEFFEFIDEPRSAFTDALYDQIVAKATGQMLSLDDFVIVTVLYSMYGRNDILRLVFNMFDKDGSGTIDEEEFMELCALVNDGAPVYPGNFKTALESFDVNDDGLIDFAEFQALNKRFPLVLFPAFRLQDAIQANTLGAKEWLGINERITEKRRMEIYKAKHGGLPPPTMRTKLAHSDKLQFRAFRCCCPCLVPKTAH